MVIILNSITVSELKKLDNIDIIDIRSEEKYNDNHILNAYNIPYNKLINNPERYLDRDNTYYIYCQKGIKSTKVCNILHIKGFNVINIIGGYEAWVLTE